MSLDREDPRPPYQQVAARLRAEILTGVLAPGDKLGSGARLAQRYGVARMTVQQAIRVLRDEGLVVSRSGSGVYVRTRTHRPVGLRPHVEEAFRASEVTINFAGLSGETLAGALVEPLDQVRTGALSPNKITLRAMVPDPQVPWSLPCSEDLGDDPEFRRRAGRILDRSLGSVVAAINELHELGLVATVDTQVRVHRSSPIIKVYILNDSEVFFSYYPVVPRMVTIDDGERKIFDLMGKDATLFHHSASDDPDSVATRYVEQTRIWFDSMWFNVATPYKT